MYFFSFLFILQGFQTAQGLLVGLFTYDIKIKQYDNIYDEARARARTRTHTHTHTHTRKYAFTYLRPQLRTYTFMMKNGCLR